MRTVLVCLVLSLSTTAAAVEFPDRPADRGFIADEVDLIDDEDEARIVDMCDRLLTEMGVPIIVVTIRSQANYLADNITIERYAQLMFDEWGIGFEEWNHGILLLVSVTDRKARIELGADWRGTRDAESRQIMDDLILPRFKSDDYSQGIVDGVRGLDAMARGLDIPRPPRPWWHYALVVGLVALAGWTAVSLKRRGASGWAWAFWAAVFAVLFFVLMAMLRSKGKSGGYSGGSFGGGSSGGGGATGSW